LSCDCKTCWDKKCSNTLSWFSKYNNGNSLPEKYVPASLKYINIMRDTKNDPIFAKAICAKVDILDGKFCYSDIAFSFIDIKKIKRYEIEGYYEYIMDYLTWSYGIPYNEDNFLRKEFEKAKTKKIRKKYKLRTVKARTGQEEYRKDLLKIYQKCEICGLENNSLLVASHLKPYSVSDDNECIDFNNGLLLCSQHDKLIDSGLISFDDLGNICISPQLSDKDIKVLNLNSDINIYLDEYRMKYMKWHRENIYKNEKGD